MYTNLAIDFGIGLVPVIGDFADAWFKCNTRNNILLERFLRERGAKHPAPPAPPKQSTTRTWFGQGPSAPGNQAVLESQGDAPPVPASVPDLPARKGFNVFGSKAAAHGGNHGVDRDLEAQPRGEEIHYSREQ